MLIKLKKISAMIILGGLALAAFSSQAGAASYDCNRSQLRRGDAALVTVSDRFAPTPEAIELPVYVDYGPGYKYMTVVNTLPLQTGFKRSLLRIDRCTMTVDGPVTDVVDVEVTVQGSNLIVTNLYRQPSALRFGMRNQREAAAAAQQINAFRE